MEIVCPDDDIVWPDDDPTYEFDTSRYISDPYHGSFDFDPAASSPRPAPTSDCLDSEGPGCVARDSATHLAPEPDSIQQFALDMVAGPLGDLVRSWEKSTAPRPLKQARSTPTRLLPVGAYRGRRGGGRGTYIAYHTERTPRAQIEMTSLRSGYRLDCDRCGTAISNVVYKCNCDFDLCPSCVEALRGSPSGVCPECCRCFNPRRVLDDGHIDLLERHARASSTSPRRFAFEGCVEHVLGTIPGPSPPSSPKVRPRRGGAELHSLYLLRRCSDATVESGGRST